jgi:hypothetical protein
MFPLMEKSLHSIFWNLEGVQHITRKENKSLHQGVKIVILLNLNLVEQGFLFGFVRFVEGNNESHEI